MGQTEFLDDCIGVVVATGWVGQSVRAQLHHSQRKGSAGKGVALQPPAAARADVRLDELGKVVGNGRPSIRIAFGRGRVTTGDRDGDPGHSHPKI
jgi:hypothetical protein